MISWNKEKCTIKLTISEIDLHRSIPGKFVISWKRGDHKGKTETLYPNSNNLIVANAEYEFPMTIMSKKANNEYQSKKLKIFLKRYFTRPSKNGMKEHKYYGSLVIDFKNFDLSKKQETFLILRDMESAREVAPTINFSFIIYVKDTAAVLNPNENSGLSEGPTYIKLDKWDYTNNSEFEQLMKFQLPTKSNTPTALISQKKIGNSQSEEDLSKKTRNNNKINDKTNILNSKSFVKIDSIQMPQNSPSPKSKTGENIAISATAASISDNEQQTYKPENFDDIENKLNENGRKKKKVIIFKESLTGEIIQPKFSSPSPLNSIDLGKRRRVSFQYNKDSVNGVKVVVPFQSDNGSISTKTFKLSKQSLYNIPDDIIRQLPPSQAQQIHRQQRMASQSQSQLLLSKPIGIVGQVKDNLDIPSSNSDGHNILKNVQNRSTKSFSAIPPLNNELVQTKQEFVNPSLCSKPTSTSGEQNGDAIVKNSKSITNVKPSPINTTSIPVAFGTPLKTSFGINQPSTPQDNSTPLKTPPVRVILPSTPPAHRVPPIDQPSSFDVPPIESIPPPPSTIPPPLTGVPSIENHHPHPSENPQTHSNIPPPLQPPKTISPSSLYIPPPLSPPNAIHSSLSNIPPPMNNIPPPLNSMTPTINASLQSPNINPLLNTPKVESPTQHRNPPINNQQNASNQLASTSSNSQVNNPSLPHKLSREDLQRQQMLYMSQMVQKKNLQSVNSVEVLNSTDEKQRSRRPSQANVPISELPPVIQKQLLSAGKNVQNVDIEYEYEYEYDEDYEAKLQEMRIQEEKKMNENPAYCLHVIFSKQWRTLTNPPLLTSDRGFPGQVYPIFATIIHTKILLDDNDPRGFVPKDMFDKCVNVIATEFEKIPATYNDLFLTTLCIILLIRTQDKKYGFSRRKCDLILHPLQSTFDKVLINLFQRYLPKCKQFALNFSTGTFNQEYLLHEFKEIYSNQRNFYHFGTVLNNFIITRFSEIVDNMFLNAIIMQNDRYTFTNAVTWNSFLTALENDNNTSFQTVRQAVNVLMMVETIAKDPGMYSNVCPDLPPSLVSFFITHYKKDKNITSPPKPNQFNKKFKLQKAQKTHPPAPPKRTSLTMATVHAEFMLNNWNVFSPNENNLKEFSYLPKYLNSSPPNNSIINIQNNADSQNQNNIANTVKNI